jgi:3-hydroxyacyl-CoA dehydrogenase
VDGKTPIVVNDSRGFANRCVMRYIAEGIGDVSPKACRRR